MRSERWNANHFATQPVYHSVFDGINNGFHQYPLEGSWENQPQMQNAGLSHINFDGNYEKHHLS